jgi:CBS-domain-containing membrane protein
MTPIYKSIICAIVLAALVGWAVAYFWQATAASFAGGLAFVVGLIVFGRAFGVPTRP